jgi:hypothetical protein
MKMFFLLFYCNAAPVERNWQGKPKYSEKNLSQCHFVHHKSHMSRPRDRTRSSAVRGRRLTSWAMARPMALFSALDAYMCLLLCASMKCRFVSTVNNHRRRWSWKTWRRHLESYIGALFAKYTSNQNITKASKVYKSFGRTSLLFLQHVSAYKLAFKENDYEMYTGITKVWTNQCNLIFSKYTMI